MKARDVAPEYGERPMRSRWIQLLLLLQMVMAVWMMPMGASAQEMVSAQGVGEGTYEMTLSDEQIEEWLGRERRVNHPAVSGLEHRDDSSLHFYFSRNYGQRAESVIRTAASAREKSLRYLPPETVDDIHVYLLGNINEYFEAVNSRGRAPEWAAGLTILHDGVILIRLAPSGMSRIEPERTLAHELNHAALRRYTRGNYLPHWFYEGLAMVATDDWGLARSEVLGRAAMAGNLLDLDEIDPAFGKTGALVDLAYAESAHFVSWLDKTYGDASIRQLIREVSEGKRFEDAFGAAFGRSPRAAFAKWHEAMSKNESILASIFSKDGLFFFISLFAAVGLCVALWRKNAIRKRRKESMNQAIPVTALPENLRDFGPFVRR